MNTNIDFDEKVNEIIRELMKELNIFDFKDLKGNVNAIEYCTNNINGFNNIKEPFEAFYIFVYC